MHRIIKKAAKKYEGELFYTASRYFYPFVGLVTSTVAAVFILPEDMGALQSIVLLVPYFSFLQMGVINGLNRNLAFYKAQGNHARVQSMVNTSFTVALIIAGVGLLFGLTTLFYVTIIVPKPAVYAWGAGILLLTLLFAPLSSHFDTTYRSGREFRALGLIGFIEGAAGLFCGLLPIILGYVGKAAADMFKAFLTFFLRWKKQPIPAQVRFLIVDYRALVAIGFPLMAGGFFWGLLTVADQSLIALRLGAGALGYYTLSRLILTAVVVLPSSMAVLLYPRASAAYGISKDNRALRPFFWKSLIFNVMVLIPVCLMIYFLIDPLTHMILPKYIPGIAAAKINILTCMTLVSQGPSIIVGVVKRNFPHLAAILVTLAVMWIVGLRMLDKGASLEDISVLRFVCSAALSIFTVCYCYWLTTLEEYNE